MIPTYPTTLPRPDYGNYSGSVDEGLLRTQVPSARAFQNISYNMPATELSLTFSMTNEDYVAWNTWVLANAFDWFDMPVVAPAETVPDITTTQRCRFTSAIQYQKKGDYWLSVTVAAEVIPYAA
jgi:hypothetical protein